MALSEAEKQSRAAKRRLTAALKEEAHAHRREAMRLEWREKGMYLTREQAAAGEPCRACGLPVIDNLGSWPPLMYLTDEQRQEREQAEAHFKERHPDCHASRWSMAGSKAAHCSLCCPPIPMSAGQLETISRIFNSHVRREEELDIWALELTCGHRVERSVHHTNRYWSGSTVRCPECNVTRGVVTSARIVEAADRMAEVKRKRESDLRRTERDLAKAEAAVAEVRKKLATLRAAGGSEE